MSVISDSKYLESKYTPRTLAHRETEQKQVKNNIQSLQNVHLHGPRGTGKTQLAKQVLEQSNANTCYINCLKHDTQYKVLKQLLEELGRKSVKTGHHTSELQRRLEKQIDVLETLIVLDNLDFLLLNDADDLLYFLSRINTDLGIILITANHADLSKELEERTFSSLHPVNICLEPYTEKQAYEILANRAENALKPQSLHREALNHIASSTQNISLGLIWLRNTAEKAEHTITESLVNRVRETAGQQYVRNQLNLFSSEHKTLYRIIIGLTENSSSVSTGTVYQRYQKKSENPLSNRRISDYLKQLEQLQLITSNYHYGGSKGKTREIELTKR